MSKKREIKYRLEYQPNPNACSIHINETLIFSNEIMIACSDLGGEEKLDKNDEKLALKLLELCANIEGVENMHIHKYDIGIFKGEAFDWEDIIPTVINTISYCLGTEVEMKEKDAPIIRPPLTPKEIVAWNNLLDDCNNMLDGMDN